MHRCGYLYTILSTTSTIFLFYFIYRFNYFCFVLSTVSAFLFYSIYCFDYFHFILSIVSTIFILSYLSLLLFIYLFLYYLRFSLLSTETVLVESESLGKRILRAKNTLEIQQECNIIQITKSMSLPISLQKACSACLNFQECFRQYFCHLPQCHGRSEEARPNPTSSLKCFILSTGFWNKTLKQ